MNVDYNHLFPDELTDGLNNECVGFTVSDTIGNIVKQPCDIEFSYAAGLYLSGLQPNTLGEDPYAGVAAGVVFGALSVSLETFNATDTSQLYAANFLNYTSAQRAAAKQNAQNGIKQLYTYSDYTSYLAQFQLPPMIAMNWYASFDSALQNGVMPMPQPNEQPVSKHMVEVVDNSPLGLSIKSWQGQNIGMNGLLIMNQGVFNQSFVKGYGYDPTAWRWLSLVKICLQYPHLMAYYSPFGRKA